MFKCGSRFVTKQQNTCAHLSSHGPSAKHSQYSFRRKNGGKRGERKYFGSTSLSFPQIGLIRSGNHFASGTHQRFRYAGWKRVQGWRKKGTRRGNWEQAATVHLHILTASSSLKVKENRRLQRNKNAVTKEHLSLRIKVPRVGHLGVFLFPWVHKTLELNHQLWSPTPILREQRQHVVRRAHGVVQGTARVPQSRFGLKVKKLRTNSSVAAPPEPGAREAKPQLGIGSSSPLPSPLSRPPCCQRSGPPGRGWGRSPGTPLSRLARLSRDTGLQTCSRSRPPHSPRRRTPRRCCRTPPFLGRPRDPPEQRMVASPLQEHSNRSCPSPAPAHIPPAERPRCRLGRDSEPRIQWPLTSSPADISGAGRAGCPPTAVSKEKTTQYCLPSSSSRHTPLAARPAKLRGAAPPPRAPPAPLPPPPPALPGPLPAPYAANMAAAAAVPVRQYGAWNPRGGSGAAASPARQWRFPSPGVQWGGAG